MSVSDWISSVAILTPEAISSPVPADDTARKRPSHESSRFEIAPSSVFALASIAPAN